MELNEFEDEDDFGGGEPRRTDPKPLRIIASWVARHDGLDPSLGAVVDRDFVVVDVPTMSAHRLD